MKKIILSLLLVSILSNCHSSESIVPSESIVVHDVVYKTEKIKSYPNNRYRPLLAYIQQFEDFYLASGYDKAKEKNKRWVDRLNTDIEQLLNGEITINDFLQLALYKILVQHYSRSDTIIKFLTAQQKIVILPTSEKLYTYLFSRGQGPGNLGLDLSEGKVITASYELFHLLHELVQTALQLTDPAVLSHETRDMLRFCPEVGKCSHPDEMGGMYALLEAIILGTGLDACQLNHREQLKQLINYEKELLTCEKLIKEENKSPIILLTNLIVKLSQIDSEGKARRVMHHVLQLIRTKPIAILQNNPIILQILKEERLEYECSNKTHNQVRICSSIPICRNCPFSLTNDQKQWGKNQWLAYIQEGSKTKQRNAKNKGVKAPNQQGVKQKPPKPHPIIPKKGAKTAQDVTNKDISPNPAVCRAIVEQEQQTISKDLSPSPTGCRAIVEQEQQTISKDLSPSPAGCTAIVEQEQQTTSKDIPLSPASIGPSKPILKRHSSLPALKQPVNDISIKPLSLPQQLPNEKKIIKKEQKVSPITADKKPVAITIAIDNNLDNYIEYIVVPRGLRLFHMDMVEKNNFYPVKKNPQHQQLVNNIFDYSCTVSFNEFKKAWEANGGRIEITTGSSHGKLQYAAPTTSKLDTLFGIFRPHGKDDKYPTSYMPYLRYSLAYIGLRPSHWLVK